MVSQELSENRFVMVDISVAILSDMAEIRKRNLRMFADVGGERI
jgi:hypothetical protein